MLLQKSHCGGIATSSLREFLFTCAYNLIPERTPVPLLRVPSQSEAQSVAVSAPNKLMLWAGSPFIGRVGVSVCICASVYLQVEGVSLQLVDRRRVCERQRTIDGHPHSNSESGGAQWLLAHKTWQLLIEY